MASNISNSNYFSVSSYSNRGMSGLVSGMDTEGMVKQMLSGTQSKIDKLNQQKQQIDWRRSIYRDTISTINNLRSTYMDTSYGSSNKNNIANAAFFNTMKSAITSGDAVKIISTGSNALTGDMKIKVDQLASAAKLTSEVKMSGDQSINGAAMDIEAIKKALSGEGTLSFDISLDGVTKSVSFSSKDFADGNITADTITSAMQAKVKQAFGGYINVSNTDGKLGFSINIKDADGKLETGHELQITGADAENFGITPGTSSLISGMTKLGELKGVNGGTFDFTINGEKFSFSKDTTVSAMMNKINSSSAGVRIAYSSMTDSFTMESSATGAQYGIEMSQESGNLLSLMFGDGVVSAGSSVKSGALNASYISGKTLADDFTTAETSMKMKVNGKEYTFSLPRESGKTYDKATIETKLNDWLKSTFGETNGAANISYSDGRLNTAMGYEVSFAGTDVDTNDSALAELAGKNDLAIALGFSKKEGGATNIISADTDISTVSVFNGIDFRKADGTAATKVSEIAGFSHNGTTVSASFADGKLSMTGAGNYNFSGTSLEHIFGSNVTVSNGQMTASKVAKGTDAVVEINGVKTSRSSNTFTVDGITMTAEKVSSEATVIGTVRDVDTIVSGIKSFVEDYNSMMKKLSGYVTEKAEYRNYSPLTDEQKKDMSEKQIEKWEEKAKTGLVRADSDISQFLDTMKNIAYSTPKSAGIGLYSIGIDTKAWDQTGQLEIDEAALRSVLASDPDSVLTLFTDSKEGIAAQMAKACDYTAKVSSANPGTLVTLAGADNWITGEKNNDLYDQLTKINDRLEYLQDKYETERTRYWNQFSQMEKILAGYNAQSGMISQQFSG